MSTHRGEGGADYADRDLPEGNVDPGQGTYTNQETPVEARGEEPDLRGPGDTGQYTDTDTDADSDSDTDVVSARRAEPAQGGYTNSQTPNDTTDHHTLGEDQHG